MTNLRYSSFFLCSCVDGSNEIVVKKDWTV